MGADGRRAKFRVLGLECPADECSEALGRSSRREEALAFRRSALRIPHSALRIKWSLLTSAATGSRGKRDTRSALVLLGPDAFQVFDAVLNGLDMAEHH